MHDEIGTFFIVLRPQIFYTLENILLQVTISDLITNIQGGLKLEDILAVYPFNRLDDSRQYAQGAIDALEEEYKGDNKRYILVSSVDNELHTDEGNIWDMIILLREYFLSVVKSDEHGIINDFTQFFNLSNKGDKLNIAGRLLICLGGEEVSPEEEGLKIG